MTGREERGRDRSPGSAHRRSPSGSPMPRRGRSPSGDAGRRSASPRRDTDRRRGPSPDRRRGRSPRGRSNSRDRRGGGRGRASSRSRSRDNRRGGGGRPAGVSLLVRNLATSVTVEELKRAFDKFGRLRDAYIPTDFYTKEPKGFGFVEFLDRRDAEDAMYEMRDAEISGQRVSVVIARDRRKTPAEMKPRDDKRRDYQDRDRERDRDDRDNRDDDRRRGRDDRDERDEA